MSKTILDILKPKEIGVWAVVLNGFVVDTHIGHPELYNSPLANEFNISLIQHSSDRGTAKIGYIWTGERFIKNV